ncbi:MAG: helix-turn-helix domain-containing protein [Deltaproteobacteria bacterium]|nr:helix-turn-helix domain-containing protein [Deltaproteobacteria bacterium]
MSEEKLTLGEFFKQEREKRKIDLKQIEEKTKISAQTLKFLEEDRLDVLPPRAFLRGFLQVIAREFDMDEELLLQYMEETMAASGYQEPLSSRKQAPGKNRLVLLTIIVAIVLIVILTFGFCVKKGDDTTQSGLDTYIHPLANSIEQKGPSAVFAQESTVGTLQSCRL